MSRVAPEVSSSCVSCSMDQRRHAQDGAPFEVQSIDGAHVVGLGPGEGVRFDSRVEWS